jgi:F-type H+-transporting ATPase subunit b
MPKHAKATLLDVLTVLALALLGAGAAWAAGGHYSDAMVKELYYRIMNFSVLIVVLVVLARKPLKKGLSDRVQGIKDELADLESRKAKAQAELAEVEKRLKDAEGDRETIVAEFRAQGEKERAKIIAAAEDSAIRIKVQAQFTIDQETAVAKAELRKEVAQLSASLAEDLLKQKITAEDQTRLVDEYLAKVQQEVQ